MFHASFQTVLMLFCTDGCISVVDKTTDSPCLVFYIERGGKETGFTNLCLLEKDRGELSTRCLMPHFSGILFYSFETQGILPLQSHFSDPGTEEDSKCQKERHTLSPIPSSFVRMIFKVFSNFHNYNSMQLHVSMPALSLYKMQLERTCFLFVSRVVVKQKSYVGIQESWQRTNNWKSTI